MIKGAGPEIGLERVGQARLSLSCPPPPPPLHPLGQLGTAPALHHAYPHGQKEGEEATGTGVSRLVGGGLCTLSQGAEARLQGKERVTDLSWFAGAFSILTLKVCPRKSLSPVQIRMVCLGMSRF